MASKTQVSEALGARQNLFRLVLALKRIILKLVLALKLPTGPHKETIIRKSGAMKICHKLYLTRKSEILKIR